MKYSILLFALLALSCSNSKENLDFRLLPNDVPFHEVSLDGITDYGQLSHLVDSLECNWNLNVLLRISMNENKFETKPKDKNQIILQPINFCDHRGAQERNVLHIFNDSKLVENEYRNIVFPEDSLKIKLNQFLLNPENRYDLASSPNRAILYFNLNPQTPLPKVAEILRKTALVFQEIQHENSNEKLFFVPILYRFVPPPPPLPKIN